MRLSYHKETDSLYIHLVERPGVEAEEVAKGLIIDFDADGLPVGIDIEHARNVIDLTKLDTESLPLKGKAA